MSVVVAMAASVAAAAAEPEQKPLAPYACLDDRTPAPAAQEIIAACTVALNNRPSAILRLNLLVRRAEGYDMAGDGPRAVADFDAAKTDSRFFGFLGERGSDLVGRRDYGRAIADLKESTRLRPDYEIGWVNLAVAYLNSGDTSRGEETLKHAISITDRDPVTHNALGHLYLQRGDKVQALAEFNAAIAAARRAGPDDSYSHATGQAYAGRAILEFEKGDTAAALVDLDADVNLSPKFAGAYNDGCYQRAVANVDLKRAEALCDRAVELSKHDWEELDSRALLNAREGRWNDVQADADAALKVNPRLASALYLRGLAKLHLGDPQGGHADISAAQRRDPAIVRRFDAWDLKAP
ncbi:MAG TPA: tetratricopeptide repeat protein [Caulobacteraceae bacterium]|nr:tetratricopeptide repeat protein [Caulobacteraceae bacterium]